MILSSWYVFKKSNVQWPHVATTIEWPNLFSVLSGMTQPLTQTKVTPSVRCLGTATSKMQAFKVTKQNSTRPTALLNMRTLIIFYMRFTATLSYLSAQPPLMVNKSIALPPTHAHNRDMPSLSPTRNIPGMILRIPLCFDTAKFSWHNTLIGPSTTIPYKTFIRKIRTNKCKS